MNISKYLYVQEPGVSRSWMQIAIIGLGIAGIYSVIVASLRAPQISSMISNMDIFKSALVVHVNLSVLVWLLSMLASFWSIGSSYGLLIFAIDNMLIRLGQLSMFLMAISPLFGGMPIMNNYVPILENLVFIFALSLFLVAIFIKSLIVIYYSLADFYGYRCSLYKQYDSCDRLGFSSLQLLASFQLSTAIIFIASCFCFVFSCLDVSKAAEIVPLDIDFFYEMIFWSAGHLLQFVYTSLMLIALLFLFEESCQKISDDQMQIKLNFYQMYKFMFFLNMFLALVGVFGHIQYEVIDGSFKVFFTNHMIYLGGIVPILFVMLLLYEYFLQKKIVPLPLPSYMIISSLLLFGFGGVVGSVISGVNVTIPAHYHGSILGVSVSLMGVAYLRICNISQHSTALKINQLKHFIKIAKMQIIIFTTGQALHIIGLALAGGYGVLRKSPGVEVPIAAKFYMAMVGGGGLIAVIGGLIFVYICVKKL